MQKLSLNDTRSIPQMGFGVWQIPEETTENAVATAIGLGYRLIDGARIYGNEAGMGRGVRNSGVAREDLFVTSKVWNSDQGRDAARAAIRGSLERTGLDYLDLMLIHWPCPEKDLYVETWQALIEARDTGLVRSIGVSNFTATHLDRIIAKTGVAPALNQIELHPRMQQSDMRAANAERGVITQSWSPLGRANAFSDPTLVEIARRLDRSVPQVILRWHIQLGLSVIPRSSNPDHMASNFAAQSFELSDADMAAIEGMETGARIGPDPDAAEFD
ncbi:aldo/keto reductase [Pseudooceanicola sediminis]|uniref:Aldo/keto reductase n=1 Tax=Pseudooceanicola sediminis TaxID=2211117 RepID=A0A399J1L4_9RHOB|nr:aldo/keto reductase [Pseudooceanicola sediminis]KAA2316254.1 aldo/keto reductase [Puniceibacterium sp. HSS470]RII39164.1 aldo/keto reductase [Pseudooceanicola sediminis]|tara:strand:+ start:82659 stop:83480 length:822 start_codon:yes stop_codon:yes gene_type:complete